MLRKHSTFSIAPAKIKVSPSLFIFTHKKYIFDNDSFLTMVPIKIKMKGFGENAIENVFGSSSLKSEKVQGCEGLVMKITSLESLHSVL